jgi:hypothetical protein
VGSGCGILAVAGAKNPEPLARIVLDLEIVTDRDELGVALPPFAENPLRTVRPPDAPPDAPPREICRRMVGEQCDGLDGLRRG